MPYQHVWTYVLLNTCGQTDEEMGEGSDSIGSEVQLTESRVQLGHSSGELLWASPLTPVSSTVIEKQW